MDNASKAIIYAGAVLIAVGLMSLVMFFFQSFKSYNDTKDEMRNLDEVRSYNLFFENSNYSIDGTYNDSGALINGFDVYNLITRIQDDNNRGNSFNEIAIEGAPDIVTLINTINGDRNESGVRKRIDLSALDNDKLDILRAKYRYQISYLQGTGYISKVTFTKVSS